MNTIPRKHRGVALNLATSIGCLAASAGAFAQAQESPYYIGVTQGLTRDSNVHRRASNETADTVWTSGVIAGLNLNLGRQRLFADANAQVHRYHRVSDLDNKSFGVRGGLDWETIETLSGTLRYDVRDSLNTLTAPDGSTFLSDQRTQQFTASARYGLASHLMFDLGYDHRALEVKSAGGRDFSQDTVSAGLRWAVGGKLTLGAGVRATRGEQETVPVADETRRRDIDLTATWAPGGFSTFNARLSATKETHSLGSNADLSETTGALSWSYRPTAKLTINTTATRDTGKETTFSAASGSTGAEALPADSTRIGTAFAMDAQYELTGKISLNGNVRQRKGTLSNSQSEAVKGYGLGLSYQPTRSLALRCSANREERTVGGANAYEVTLTGCTGELTLR
jgi:opacity protein-like surface antigen